MVNLKIAGFLLILCAFSSSAQTNIRPSVGVAFDGKVNRLTINGINVGKSTIFGSEKLLVEFLGRSWLDDVRTARVSAPCACVLVGNVGQCVFDYLPKVASTVAYTKGEYLVILVDDKDFLRVAGQVLRGGGNSGGPPDRPGSNNRGGTPPKPPKEDKVGSESAIGNQPASSPESACQLAGEICVNSKGEVSFSLGCEGKFKFELSSTGKLKMSVSNATGQSISTPIFQRK